MTTTHVYSPASGAPAESRWPFYILAFYLVVEYARLAFLTPLRPALVLQLFLAICILSRIDQVKVLLKEAYFKMYFCMLALMVVHVFIAINNYWAFMLFQTMLTYLLISLSIVIFLNTPQKIYKFICIFVFIMTLAAISRLAGAGVIGATGLMGDENDFALAMNVALPMSFFLSRDAKGLSKWFFYAASCLFVLGNIVSQSRGGFLGLAAVAGICWLYSEHKVRSLIALLLLAVLAWNFAPPQFKKELAELGVESSEKDTGKDRIELWKVGWRAYVDNPVIGVGQGNMPVVMEIYQYDEKGNSYWGRGLWGRAIHSLYLTLLPELGTIGVILFLGMLRFLYKRHRKTKEFAKAHLSEPLARQVGTLNVALAVSVIAYLCTGVFISVFYYPQFWNLAALVIGLNFAAVKAVQKNENLGRTRQSSVGRGKRFAHDH